MKLIKLIFVCIALLTAANSLDAAGSPTLNWRTNYEEALNESKQSSKPIVLFFTGSDWCGWCNKLESEVFDTQAFQDLAGDKFIFVKLDYPMYAPQDPRLASQNKQLQKKYNIRSYPTLVVLDRNQQQIGLTGYKAGGGRAYAAHVLEMVKN